MIAFNPDDTNHVATLISWWGQISDDERGRLFHPSLHGLGPFLRFFTVGDAAHLLLSIDKQGVWVVAWTSPFWDGALFSAWIRSDRRATKTAWSEIQLAYNLAFDAYPVLFSFTRQPVLHAELMKLGYDYSGKLNRAFANGPIWLYELTKEHWMQRESTARQYRLARRERRETNHARNRVGNQLGNEQQHDDQPLRADSGEVRETGREDGGTDSEPGIFANAGSSQNGRS